MKERYNHILVACSLLLCCCGCSFTTAKDNNTDCVKDNFKFAQEQLQFAIKEVNYARLNEPLEAKETRIKKNLGELVSPRNVEKDGSLHLVPSGDWTSGFFPGELWMMYEYTGNNFWRKEAQRYTEALEKEKLNGRTHDMGFKMLCSYGNGYRLTQDMRYKDILIQAAKTLSTRFRPKAGIIRSWDHNKQKWQCPVIIDNMMNLELLFWATKTTGDSTYYKIAVSHAMTTMKNHFRPDFSSYHVVDYDTLTGKVIKKNTHQGYADESAWARGQAWALYGYTMCYRETGKKEFLEQAVNVEKYIFGNKNMPDDLIPYWDFDVPNIEKEPRDVSAATVMASALYELSRYVKGYKSRQYKDRADTIIRNLTGHYRATPGKDCGFLLLHSTGTKPTDTEVDVPIVYADYYFLEALLRKDRIEQNKTLF